MVKKDQSNNLVKQMAPRHDAVFVKPSENLGEIVAKLAEYGLAKVKETSLMKHSSAKDLAEGGTMFYLKVQEQ